MGIDFTILISGGGFTDQLMQFRAFYKLGRSLGLRYRHTPFESERSGRGIFDFLGFNQQFDAVLAPASDRPPLEIPLSDERLEREAASSFAGVQTLVRREIEARAGADSLIAFRLTGGRAFFADIHAALSEEPDELDLRTAYARHRARQPWRSRFEPNTIQILVHIRQGDTAVIRTPWDTFVPLRGPDALREVDEIDEPLRSSLIDVPEYADLLAALMRGLDEPCSAVVCSDGYALPFRKIRQHAEQLGLTDGQRRQLSELETTYQSRFDVFRGMPRTTCLIGEGEEHLFDLVHAALSADIMVVGTQQRMIPKLIASYPDLERPQILALLHRTAEPPDHERDLGLGPRQATLVPVQVGERNLEHAVDRIRHVLAERPRLGPVRLCGRRSAERRR